MKTLFTYVAALCLVSFSCGQSSAPETTDQNGAYLKATIDGKAWQASKMTEYGAGSDYKLVNGEANEITIGFQIHKPTTGLVREFSENYAADLMAEDGIFGSRKGKVTVTKVDEKWIEGNFYFTANSLASGKTHEVKNGLFRIPNR